MRENTENIRKIRNFIEHKLENKLKKDQKNLKILSEGDLQSCVYSHLRKLFDKNKMPNWYLTNKLTMGSKKENKKIPDIAIVRTKENGRYVRPVFLIELKEDYQKIRPKKILPDLKKLNSLVKKNVYFVEKTYFIYSVLDQDNSPTDTEDKIYELNPNRDDYLHVMVINTMWDKPKHPREKEIFIKKFERLRKFRPK